MVIDIIVFNELPKELFQPFSYGGHETKFRAKLNDGYWMVKSEGDLRQKREENNQNWPSKDSSCISEWLSSKIYKSLSITVQTTMLGRYSNNLMIACKHFYDEHEHIVEMRDMLKNWILLNPQALKYKPSNTMIDILEMFKFLERDTRLGTLIDKLKCRFWDMFIVDAFIGNSDRHMGNWGVILNDNSLSYRLAPVYDNGSSFRSRWREEQFENRINATINQMKSDVYGTTTPFVAFRKRINPYKYINDDPCKDCVDALLRVTIKIDLLYYTKLINELYENNLISQARNIFFKKFLQANYEIGLKPAYLKALKNIKTNYIFPDLKQSFHKHIQDNPDLRIHNKELDTSSSSDTSFSP